MAPKGRPSSALPKSEELGGGRGLSLGTQAVP